MAAAADADNPISARDFYKDEIDGGEKRTTLSPGGQMRRRTTMAGNGEGRKEGTPTRRRACNFKALNSHIDRTQEGFYLSTATHPPPIKSYAAFYV